MNFRRLLFVSAAMLVIQCSVAQVLDSISVLCIGNSFTYVCDTHEKLKEIAASEGHYMTVRAVFPGGYSFNRHLHDVKSISAIEEEGYDYVFLQNQSQMLSRYAKDPERWHISAEDTKEIAARIREYSPEAKLVLEQTWAYAAYKYGGCDSMEDFDRMLSKGAVMLSQMINSGMSPIGDAFALCRQERPDIALYAKDEHHQSEFGAYLKSAVNYLIIYGRPFSENTSSCSLDPEICKYLRGVAERIVLKK